MRSTTFWTALLIGVGPLVASSLAHEPPVNSPYPGGGYSQPGGYGYGSPAISNPYPYGTPDPYHQNSGAYGPWPDPRYGGNPGVPYPYPYPPAMGGNTPPPGNYPPYPGQPGPSYNPGFPPIPAPITALADQLVNQAEDFRQAFVPKIGIVPQGRQFMSDATALSNAASALRQAAASGAPPQVLAARYRAVESCWQRFENRMARVSKGNIGPNIATALQMGGTIEQIGRLLP